MHFLGANLSTTFIDSATGKTATVVGNTAHSITASPWADGSAIFDGTGDYISVPDSADLRLADSDFTIDFWMRPIACPSSKTLLYKWGTTTKSYAINLIGAAWNQVQFAASSDGTTSAVNITAATPAPIGSWTHVAITRKNDAFASTCVIRLFINGILEATHSGAHNLSFYGASNALAIGAYDDGTFCYNGYIDEFRLSKGIARWEKNFTPPTRGY
jgi:hypothetical protein